MRPQKREQESLADIVDRVLDKGLVINADIAISFLGTELLGIKVRAALASFETAARYGLKFPADTRLDLPVWQEALVAKESCPDCGKRTPRQELLDAGCPWCGFRTKHSAVLTTASIKGGDQ
jgi:ribosomal protein L37AE/L43A